MIPCIIAVYDSNDGAVFVVYNETDFMVLKKHIQYLVDDAENHQEPLYVSDIRHEIDTLLASGQIRGYDEVKNAYEYGLPTGGMA